MFQLGVNDVPSQLTWRCPACRIKALVPASATSISCCCGYEQLSGLVPGLGDWIAAGLHRIGITRYRYQRVKKWLGLNPSCKCPERQEWLNTIGKRLKLWLTPWKLRV